MSFATLRTDIEINCDAQHGGAWYTGPVQGARPVRRFAERNLFRLPSLNM